MRDLEHHDFALHRDRPIGTPQGGGFASHDLRSHHMISLQPTRPNFRNPADAVWLCNMYRDLLALSAQVGMGGTLTRCSCWFVATTCAGIVGQFNSQSQQTRIEQLSSTLIPTQVLLKVGLESNTRSEGIQSGGGGGSESGLGTVNGNR